VSFITRNGNPFGNFQLGTTHSGPFPFLQRVPLIFYGPGYIRPQGEIRLDREVTLADVVPTLAKLLKTPPPGSTDGRPITEALLPPRERADDLRLIVTIVWDGGGRNVLERWRGSWPSLEALSEEGTSIMNATVGSSPSVTPPIHATLGTGAFPNTHGIVNISQKQGSKMVASFGGINPQRLEAQTLADVYDKATGNKAKIGIIVKDAMHLGMVGHGAYTKGGDHDIAVLTNPEVSDEIAGTNPRWYSLPPYMRSLPGLEQAADTVDRADGELDGEWMGHAFPDEPVEESGFSRAPVWTLYQTEMAKTLLEREGFGSDRVPDLFFTNYKDPDYVGHAYNFFSEEEREAISYADAALGELASWLDQQVGRERWVLAMTADHGQSPLPQEVGDWPIDVVELGADISDFVGVEESLLIEELKQTGVWFNNRALWSSDVTKRDVSHFLLTYTIRDNATPGDVPEAYSDRLDEPLFAAAFPSSRLDAVLRCARRASG
jgi:hypothetical protein